MVRNSVYSSQSSHKSNSYFSSVLVQWYSSRDTIARCNGQPYNAIIKNDNNKPGSGRTRQCGRASCSDDITCLTAFIEQFISHGEKVLRLIVGTATVGNGLARGVVNYTVKNERAVELSVVIQTLNNLQETAGEEEINNYTSLLSGGMSSSSDNIGWHFPYWEKNIDGHNGRCCHRCPVHGYMCVST